MKKSKNEVEFVELKKFDSVGHCWKTDLFCVSCKKWFCWRHMKECVQCEQPVCKECYVEDLCSLVRPWGEKTEEHLKTFYENKLVDVGGMDVTIGFLVSNNDEEEREAKSNIIRKDVMKKSVELYVGNFEISLVSNFEFDTIQELKLLAKCFPSISKYVENEETRLKFVDFYEKYRWIKQMVIRKYSCLL